MEASRKSRRRSRALAAFAAFVALLAPAACSTAPREFGVAAEPAPASRLRVFIQPLESGGSWRTPYAQYARMTFDKVAAVWQASGVYEAVSLEEADAVLGSSRSRLPWKRDGYALARGAAEALKADYAMLVERTERAGEYRWETTLVNARSGAAFKVTMPVPGGSRDDYQPIIAASYERLFMDTRSDMMATASSRRAAPGTAPALPPPVEVSREIALPRPPATAATVIAVYDLEAPGGDPLVAAILSEALRAEFVAAGGFRLVERSDLDRVLAELELQRSGIVDESSAVAAGEGLAARQIVIGTLGAIGRSVVLQAKRLDVATHETLGAASIRCEAGREEELLDGMDALVRELAGL